MKKQPARRSTASKLALKREIVRQLNTTDLARANAGTWCEATLTPDPAGPRDCYHPAYSA